MTLLVDLDPISGTLGRAREGADELLHDLLAAPARCRDRVIPVGYLDEGGVGEDPEQLAWSYFS